MKPSISSGAIALMLEANNEFLTIQTLPPMTPAMMPTQLAEASTLTMSEPHSSPRRLPLSPQPFEAYRDPQTGVWMVIYPEQ